MAWDVTEDYGAIWEYRKGLLVLYWFREKLLEESDGN